MRILDNITWGVSGCSVNFFLRWQVSVLEAEVEGFYSLRLSRTMCSTAR